MHVSEQYKEYVLDQLHLVNGVSARKMFGGWGVYAAGAGGKMFGLLYEESLYLKTDEVNRPDYEAAGMPPFIPSFKGKNKKAAPMPYHQVPEEVVEDPEALKRWADKAIGAVLRKAK